MRARTKPVDCMLLENIATRSAVIDSFVTTLNHALSLRFGNRIDAVGGLFTNRSPEKDVIVVESAMQSNGRSRGRGRSAKGGWPLQQHFLEHRLALPPELMALSPMPFLAPVPSGNYLRQLLLHGFPDAVDPSEEDLKWQQGQSRQPQQPSAAMLSLTDAAAFTRRVQGRRLAILGLYLPPLPMPGVATNPPDSVVALEVSSAQAYLQGAKSLAVSSPRQLLPPCV